jgi:hypothetical protein
MRVRKSPPLQAIPTQGRQRGNLPNFDATAFTTKNKVMVVLKKAISFAGSPTTPQKLPCAIGTGDLISAGQLNRTSPVSSHA